MKNVTIPERLEIFTLMKNSLTLKKKNTERLSSTSSVTYSNLKINFGLAERCRNIVLQRSSSERGNRQQAGKSRGKYMLYLLYCISKIT